LTPPPVLERSLRVSAILIALGLLVQLASFSWRHPLAFVMFGVAGGGLTAAGLGVFLVAAIRGRIWGQPIEPIEIDSADRSS
jgi:hypothetical protein